MATYDYDLFTIGAGSGGTRASRLAAIKGAKVAVAEESRVGGTCVVRGCVPKKFYVIGASFRQQLKDAAAYGWQIAEPTFNWPTLRDNVAREVDRLSAIYARNLANAGVEVIPERAELVDAHTVKLASGRTVTAKTILIASGSRPVMPHQIPGCDHCISSDQAFGLESLPKRIVIVGGGYIAVEFATIFRGLGVDVCIVCRRESVLYGFDADLRVQVHSDLESHGVRVFSSSVVTSVEKKGEAFCTTLSTGPRLDSERVMFAIGRKPYTEGFGLENAGVNVNEHGAICVDAYSRTNVPSIYAIGDATDRLNLTPVAIREAVAFAATVFEDKPTSFDHECVPTAVFSEPPAATVGYTETDARKAFGQVDIYRTVFRPMRNVLAGNEDRMLMKLVVRADNHQIIGCHIVGSDAPEIMQPIAIAVKAKLTKQQWDATCALHPTVAEELVLMRDKFVPPEINVMG